MKEGALRNICFLVFILVNNVHADIWRKPDYVPDENHLPQNKIQKHEVAVPEGKPKNRKTGEHRHAIKKRYLHEEGKRDSSK
jgi:hypothetical protein